MLTRLSERRSERILIKVDTTIGELAERSLLFDLGGLLSILWNGEICQHSSEGIELEIISLSRSMILTYSSSAMI